MDVITRCINKAWICLYCVTHKIEKKIVFWSFFGKQYSDNPKAISDKLIELYPDYEIVWLLKQRKDTDELIPKNVKVVYENDRRGGFLREILTSCCFVYNCELGWNIPKRKGQLFIQTWHGDRFVKKIILDYNKTIDEIGDTKLTDICLAGSKFGVDVLYHQSFGYEGTIVNYGCPRNDILIYKDEKRDDKTREYLNIPKDYKVLLYAPTFRDNNKHNQSANVDIDEVLSSLTKNGDKWVCLVRAHVASDGINYSFSSDHIMNVSNYPDMADLLSIADMLLTDYSSCSTDFILTGKPVVLCLFDIDDYQNNSRSFKINPEDQGFFIAHNQNELKHIVETATTEQYREKDDDVKRFFGVTETGKASEMICETIDEHYKNNLYRKNYKNRLSMYDGIILQ